jgi:hypothetical protein
MVEARAGAEHDDRVDAPAAPLGPRRTSAERMVWWPVASVGEGIREGQAAFMEAPALRRLRHRYQYALCEIDEPARVSPLVVVPR